MPIYGFRRPACGMELEVSRPMKDAGNSVSCPLDGDTAARIFTPPLKLGRRGEAEAPVPVAPQQPQRQWSHFGHSHSFGAASHSHGPRGL